MGGAQTCLHHYCYLLEDALREGLCGFFKHKGEGKTHRYVAKVTRAEYTRMTMQEVKKSFFDGSVKSMFSFFVKEENLSADDIRELLSLMEEGEKFSV